MKHVFHHRIGSPTITYVGVCEFAAMMLIFLE